MTRTQFPDPPRSVRAFPSRTALYVKHPTSSLDWMGSDWESPVALSFASETMNAKTVGARATYAHERPIHPTILVRDIQRMWSGMLTAITEARVVVDAKEEIGLTIDGDLRRNEGSISARFKCWPAIEGVTVPLRDRTI